MTSGTSVRDVCSCVLGMSSSAGIPALVPLTKFGITQRYERLCVASRIVNSGEILPSSHDLVTLFGRYPQIGRMTARKPFPASAYVLVGCQRDSVATNGRGQGRQDWLVVSLSFCLSGLSLLKIINSKYPTQTKE